MGDKLKTERPTYKQQLKAAIDTKRISAEKLKQTLYLKLLVCPITFGFMEMRYYE